MPEEIVDEYFDQFQININAWGATLNCMLSSHQPPAPGAQPQSERVATLRTSVTHLKVMSYMIIRQLKQFEHDQQLSVAIPTGILASLGIAREDWDAFWRQDNGV